MAENKDTRTIQLVLRPASPGLKIAVIVLILSSMLALGTLHWVLGGLRAETNKLCAEASAVEYANQVLAEKAEKPDSVQNVRSIAKQELGLVDPDTVVIDPIS